MSNVLLKKIVKNYNPGKSTLLGLTTFLDRKPKALSGGQRQRVAIGRCIVQQPNVFLLDEPLSKLDTGSIVKLWHPSFPG